ncbi:MAG: hypothetical protein OSJ58_16155 [Dysosmobacter sp.]|jgi:hypothetical protein|nr:hypothetical protein [Dysosmobacter sp.]
MKKATIKITPPPVYAIWAEARADGPLAGQAGYLAENGERLFFVQRAEAELKIADLRNSCLNRQPAARYRCVDYFNSSLPNQDLTVEAIRTYYPQPDFDPEEYVLKGQAFGNTGGGCMVGTAAFHLPSLDKTVWVNCSCEGVSISSADYIWNTDNSGSWERYEDVSLLDISFQDSQPEELGVWRSMVQNTLRYMTERYAAFSGSPPELPDSWKSEAGIQPSDPTMTMSY